jgi:hypothetical protein
MPSGVYLSVTLLMYGPPSDCKGKVVDEESLRQCIRPVCGDVSPGHDEILRVPVPSKTVRRVQAI